MKRDYFFDDEEDTETFIPIKKGMRSKNSEYDEEVRKKPKRPYRKNHKSRDFDTDEWA